MQRQIITLFVSLFLLLSQAAAQDGTQQARGALFKVSGSGHSMYLFGTMHVGLPAFYPLEKRITEAVAQASTLALEVDTAQDAGAMARAMQEYGVFPPGSRGFAGLDPSVKARLDKVLATMHMQSSSVEGLRPWLVATVLALNEYAAQGYRSDLAVDAHMAQLAHAGKAKVIELESVVAQLSLFGRLSLEDQWRFLEESIEAIETGKQKREVREIVEAWRTADQKAFDAIAARAEEDTSVSGRFVQKVLLEERNGPIADKLAALLAREDKAVAAIGVLHLVGKLSVPLLLRARGLTVERVY
ncbi:MAG: TraB/GumN family protein [Pseudomonadota bacterium]